MSLAQTLAALHPGDHLCLFYESPQQHRHALEPFLQQGLARHEKTIYLFDALTPTQIADYLCEPGRLHTWLASGQLALLDAETVYHAGGGFVPERMIDHLQRETAQALAEGYAALRVTGEMSWALADIDPEALSRYESLLHDFFRRAPCIALCQYDRRRFAPAMLQAACFTHPLIVADDRCGPNRAYLPPSVYLSAEQRQAACRPWLEAAGGQFERLLNHALSPTV